MKYFYFDAARRDGIPSSDAKDANADEILRAWNGLSREADSFLGLHCPSGVIQFMWEAHDYITMDMPLPKEGGSMVKRATFDECNTLIAQICSGMDPAQIVGLTFVKW